MNDMFQFGGRGKSTAVKEDSQVIQAEPGSVLCLIVTIGCIEFVTYYTRMAVFDRWGVRCVNPFRRVSSPGLKHDYAEYLPRDLHIFCPARLDMIQERDWMLREG